MRFPNVGGLTVLIHANSTLFLYVSAILQLSLICSVQSALSTCVHVAFDIDIDGLYMANIRVYHRNSYKRRNTKYDSIVWGETLQEGQRVEQNKIVNDINDVKCYSIQFVNK